MTNGNLRFTTVLNKYLLYSEAVSQYHTLEEEDQKIIEPYIRRLKESWQEELELIKLNLKHQAPKKSQTVTK